MSTVIGLTGPTGAGKSLFASVAERKGFFVIDCDRIAREESDNKEMLTLLCERFGDDLLKDGCLERKLLAKRAFASKQDTDDMNSIMLPFIVNSIEKIMEDKDKVLLDAPTLFESGLDGCCDAVIGILADESLRCDRIVTRDNLSIEDAKIRLSAAKSDDFFSTRCDAVIINNGDKQEFIKKAEEILQKYI